MHPIYNSFCEEEKIKSLESALHAANEKVQSLQKLYDHDVELVKSVVIEENGKLIEKVARLEKALEEARHLYFNSRLLYPHDYDSFIAKILEGK
jgi:antirestriction protein